MCATLVHVVGFHELAAASLPWPSLMDVTAEKMFVTSATTSLSRRWRQTDQRAWEID